MVLDAGSLAYVKTDAELIVQYGHGLRVFKIVFWGCYRGD